MTVDQFFVDNVLNFTLTQTTPATATVKVYVGALGEPNAITGKTTSSYDSASHTVTLTVANPSSTLVTFYWATYTATITKAESIVLTGDTVHFNITVARGTGEAVTNYELNVTKDGDVWKQNFTLASFTDVEPNPQSHAYNVTALYDSDAGELATVNCTALTVYWQSASGGGGGAGGGATPTPPPPEETPPPSEAPPEWVFPILPKVNVQDVIVVTTAVLIAVLIVMAVAQRKPKARKIKKFEGPNLKKIPRY